MRERDRRKLSEALTKARQGITVGLFFSRGMKKGRKDKRKTKFKETMIL